MKTINFLIYSITLLFSINNYSQNEADLDNTFTPTSLNPSSNIININNQYLIISNSTNRMLVKLNNDGSVDNTFNFTGNFGSGKAIIEMQNDGKIVVAGPQYNNNNKSINRFNSDGTIDNSFNLFQNIPQLNTIKIQNDGKILFGGQNTGNFGRLNSDGSLDSTFITGSNIYHSNNTYVSIESIKIDSNNKILIGGTYNRYNGNVSNGLTRINMDGSFDNTLNIGTGFNYDWVIVKDIEIQNDGKIVVGGGFNSFNGSYVSRLIRLNSNGTKDVTFNSSANDFIYDILIQNNGKIIIGGAFTSVTGGINKNRLCRFNTDGTIDNTFDILTGFDNTVSLLFNDSNNKLIITGGFSSYQNVSTFKNYKIKRRICFKHKCF